MRAIKAWRELLKLPSELWLLCLALFINRLGTMVMPFLVLYLTRIVGFSAPRSALFLVVYGVVGIGMAPLSGAIADRWGKLRMMEISLVCFAAVVLLYPLAQSWAAVLAMTILLSGANEAFRPAALAVVGELGTGERRKSAFTLYRFASNLGLSVGPALGGLLAERSFSLLFIVDGLTTLAAAAILTFSPFHSAMKAREERDRDTRGQIPSMKWSGPLAALREDSTLRVFLLGAIPVLMVFWHLQSPLPLFLVRDLGFPSSAYGVFFTINTLIIITTEVPLTSAIAHWPHRRSLVLGSCLFAIGFGELAFAHTYSQVALAIGIWTCGEMVLFPAMSAYVSEIAPPHRQGEYMGLYTMTFSFAFILGPWLGTLMLEHYGPTALWGATFVLGMTSAVMLGLRARTGSAVEARTRA